MSIPAGLILQARKEAAEKMLQLLMHRNHREQCLEPKYQQLSYHDAAEMVQFITQGKAGK